MNCYALLLSLAFGTLTLSPKSLASSRPTYTAGVVEYPITLSLKSKATVPVIDTVWEILSDFDKLAAQASLANVDILVFPEYGIIRPFLPRQVYLKLATDIPFPGQNTNWNPCKQLNSSAQDIGNSSSVAIMRNLSCIARKHSLMIVFNFIDIKTCQKNCREDGHYLYNTNIVFDKEGRLVARYHKRTLFLEYAFDPGQDPVQYSVFQTSFGRFGLIVCFDVLFKTPAVDMIKQYNVSNVVFPTFWGNSFPYLSAIEFHPAFAAGWNVNFLASGINQANDPLFRSTGTGIYAGSNGVLTYNYQPKGMNKGKLLVSSNLRSFRKIRNPSSAFHNTYFDNVVCPSKLDPLGSVRKIANSTTVPLSAGYGNLTLCIGKVKCHLEYKFAKKSPLDNYVFVAADSVRDNRAKGWYVQICAVNTVKASENVTSVFKFIRIRSSVNAHTFVYPVVMSARQGSLNVPPRDGWMFEKEYLSVFFDEPLVTAALYGRLYDKDPDEQSNATSSASVAFMSIFVFALIIRVIMI